MDFIFIETPDFVKKFDKLANQDEMLLLQDELLKNPARGKLIQGTGGARKIRLGVAGHGKSGGARIIYYYADFRGEIWFFDIFVKSDKANLTGSEKKKNLQIYIGDYSMKKTDAFRVTRINSQGKRVVSNMSKKQLQEYRAKRLKDVRKKDLCLTQKELADAVGVNIRTLQDWERGRTSMAKPVEILMSLMKDMPSVKNKLTHHGKAHLKAA